MADGTPGPPHEQRIRTQRSGNVVELCRRQPDTPPSRRGWALGSQALYIIKESVNQTVDQMGFYNALQSCFTLHELNHSHWAEVHDNRMPAALPQDGVTSWREAPPIVPAVKDKVRADR